MGADDELGLFPDNFPVRKVAVCDWQDASVGNEWPHLCPLPPNRMGSCSATSPAGTQPQSALDLK